MKKIFNMSFVIFIIFNTLYTVSCFAVDTKDLFNNGDKDTCNNGFCGSISYSHLRKALSGLFYSASELSFLDDANNAVVATPLNKDEHQMVTESKPSSYDDGDICCSTHVEHIQMTSMVNTNGENMTIVHFPDALVPNYQYIPYASCVRTGSCPGKCVLEHKTLTLLAYNANTPLRFDSFSVPGYCSCKNIGTE